MYVSKHNVSCRVTLYAFGVPKLWSETIDAHRHSVREAILDSAWSLATERGVLAVTMSEVAERAGIGRATLYKYFPDVETILMAQHDRHVMSHLTQLIELRDRETDAGRRLKSVAEHYATICQHRARHGTRELTALLHDDHQTNHAEQRLIRLFEELIADAATARQVRVDTAPAELATYCVHALGAAAELGSQAAVKRLVTVVLSGLDLSSTNQQ